MCCEIPRWRVGFCIYIFAYLHACTIKTAKKKKRHRGARMIVLLLPLLLSVRRMSLTELLLF